MINFRAFTLASLVLAAFTAGACEPGEYQDVERFFGLPSHVIAAFERGDIATGTEIWVTGDLVYEHGYFLLDPENSGIHLPVLPVDSEQRHCLADANGNPVRVVGRLNEQPAIYGIFSVSLLLDSGEDNFVCHFP